MIYRQNVPARERAVRVAAGLVLIIIGIALFGQPGAWLALSAGATALLTGFVGFCPACALAGRRLDRRLAARPGDRTG